MRADLRQTRTAESELRAQLALAQQQEQSCRAEWKQFEREQKQRQEQLETKCRQLGKQNDHFRTNIQALEKRVGELQLKKLEVDRELANERLVKQQQLQSDSSRQATFVVHLSWQQRCNSLKISNISFVQLGERRAVQAKTEQHGPRVEAAEARGEDQGRDMLKVGGGDPPTALQHIQ
jgi:hypothetical protein